MAMLLHSMRLENTIMQLSTMKCHACAHCYAGQFSDVPVSSTTTAFAMQVATVGSLLSAAKTLLTDRSAHKSWYDALVIAMQAADGDVRLDILLRSVPSSRRQTLLLASWLQGEVAALTAAAGWWPAQCMSLYLLSLSWRCRGWAWCWQAVSWRCVASLAATATCR